MAGRFFQNNKPELLLVVITMVWGGTFILIQLGLRDVGPFGYLALRFAIGCLALAIIFWKRLLGLTALEVKAGIIIGVMLFFVYGFVAVGLQYIPSSKSAFLLTMYVPMVPILQWLVLSRLPRLATWYGLVLCSVGLIFMSFETGGGGLDLSFGFGEAITLAAAVACALEIIFIGRFAGGTDPMRLATVQMAVVTVLALPAMVIMGETFDGITPELLINVTYMGLVGTAFILVGMNWAQKTISPSRATLIYSMEPL